jgi:hypothetical protein
MTQTSQRPEISSTQDWIAENSREAQQWSARWCLGEINAAALLVGRDLDLDARNAGRSEPHLECETARAVVFEHLRGVMQFTDRGADRMMEM